MFRQFLTFPGPLAVICPHTPAGVFIINLIHQMMDFITAYILTDTPGQYHIQVSPHVVNGLNLIHVQADYSALAPISFTNPSWRSTEYALLTVCMLMPI